MRLLTVNAGSSNTKLALFQAGDGAPMRVGKAQAIRDGNQWQLAFDGEPAPPQPIDGDPQAALAGIKAAIDGVHCRWVTPFCRMSSATELLWPTPPSFSSSLISVRMCLRLASTVSDSMPKSIRQAISSTPAAVTSRTMSLAVSGVPNRPDWR